MSTATAVSCSVTEQIYWEDQFFLRNVFGLSLLSLYMRESSPYVRGAPANVLCSNTFRIAVICQQKRHRAGRERVRKRSRSRWLTALRTFTGDIWRLHLNSSGFFFPAYVDSPNAGLCLSLPERRRYLPTADMVLTYTGARFQQEWQFSPDWFSKEKNFKNHGGNDTKWSVAIQMKHNPGS